MRGFFESSIFTAPWMPLILGMSANRYFFLPDPDEPAVQYTVVDGETVPMLPGDLVLTPNWCWHDHANDSQTPMIWLDSLDSPLVGMLEAGFRRSSSRLKAAGVVAPTTIGFVLPYLFFSHAANEIRAAMYNSEKRPPLLSFIGGLGGREVTLEDVYKATDLCYAAANSGKSEAKTHWLGVRE